MTGRKKCLWGILIIVFFLAYSNTVNAEETVIYEEGFETGLGEWAPDNGVWDVCLRSQQEEWGGGLFYVATVCDGTYPAVTDSRLVSPIIDLGEYELVGDEELRLRFWHWFSYYSSDHGTVQISAYDEGTGSWSAFTNISASIVYSSAAWSPISIDISAYAGKKVRIAFYHYTYDDSAVAAGWYVDQVEIIKKAPEWTGDFECGWGDWHADNGVWEVGTPTYGPASCYSGIQCAGTVLGGAYPSYANSRLISPTIDLGGYEVVGDEELRLRFWHWFSYYSSDYGTVQISVQDEATGSWSAFTNISAGIVYSSSVWSPMSIDISAYAGKKVRIAFYHYTYDDSAVAAGWYVDDVEIIKKVPEPPTGDFEEGWGDWHADNGVWEVGSPTYGPPSCYSGTQCAGTVLGGAYPSYADSRLISPIIDLGEYEVVGDEELRLRFWHWFSYYSSDYGTVQISAYDEGTGNWSAFINISASIVYSSAVWSPISIDISTYAGKKVRIAFYHYTYDDSAIAAGWYVDHVEVIKKAPEWTGDSECGWGDWYTDNGVWEVGTPTYGPPSCYSGTQCAGTVLGGAYPSYANSRLISPAFYLPADRMLSFSFRHWFSYYSSDYGIVQISEYDESLGSWSAFTNISGAIVNSSAGWSLMNIDNSLLNAYAGKKVRIAFYHYTYDDSAVAAGWYIDHVRISGLPHFCECDLNLDTLCDMPDWLVFGGDWGRTDCNEIDVPPCECDLNHDGSCNMLDWLRFGENWGQGDCLICEE